MATATQITTGRVRFSYVNAFTPRAAQEGAQPKYSVTLLIPKTDKNTIAKIKAAIEAAKTAYLQKHSGKKLPSALKTTMHDGDGERPNGGEFGPECKGHYVMTCSSNNKPVIVYADKTPDHRGERALFRLLRPRDRQLLCLRHERQQGCFRRPERHYEAQ